MEMKYICNTCQYSTDDKSKLMRHEKSKSHLIKIGELDEGKCVHVLESGKRKGEQCNRKCRGNICKLHKPSRKERDIKQRESEEYKNWKTNYNIENREKILEKKKEHYYNNKEKILIKQKDYYIRNKDEINKKMNIYRNNKLENNFEFVCSEKIRALKKVDVKRSRINYNEEDYINTEWLLNRLNELGNKCSYCDKDLKLMNYEQYDKDQFSVDRIDNNLPHIKNNCDICCLICNLKKH